MTTPRDPRPDAAPGRGDAMIEIWNGSNPVFEHAGHFLPPFGTYFLPLKLTMVCGIGRIDWANDAVAVAYEPHDSGATIRVVGFQARPQCTAMARTKAETVRTQGTLRPDRPLVLELSKRAEPVLLTVVQGQDEDLAEISLPWKPQPTVPETFQTLQGEMKPWTPVCMELSDWPREHAPNLAEAAKALASALPAEGQAPTTAGVSALVQAARVVMRAEAPGSPQWKAVRRALEVAVFRGTKNRHAEALLGMMMAMENGGKVSPEATKHLAQAGKLAGARYLLAMEAIAAGNLVRAETLLKQAAAEAPPVAMGLGVDAVDGNDRLHPAALVGGQWPTMIGALLALAMERPASAITTLEQLTGLDPARPEAFAILADAYAKARQPDKAALARTEAEQLFRRNDQARRDYEALLREAREGVWAGIPRP
jgi:tetratricopeptide (TPR) repeat protein